jgi:undecaprenyl-diphosphatase
MLGATLVLLGSWLVVRGHSQPGIDRFGFRVLALASGGAAAEAAPTVVDVAKVLLAACALAVLGLLMARRKWRDCMVIVAGLLVGQTAAHIAKAAISRPRPAHEFVSAGGFSFPSTTSALGMSFLFLSIAAAGLLPQRRRAATVAVGGVMTFVLGLSFVALRVHYLTDVIAGWALGVLAFMLCELVANVILGPPRARRRQSSNPPRMIG